ncbi:MAG: hypothetical protein AAF573_07210 [Bacteroidota bacterium]
MKEFTLVLVGLIFFSCNVLKEKPAPTALPPIDIPTEPFPTEPTYEIGDTQFEYWRHSPMHVGDFQSVTFRTKASDYQLITKVELYVYEYQLFKDAQGLPSKRKATNGIWGLVKTWNFNDNQVDVDLAYEYTKGFAPRSNVEYIFKVYNANNAITERFAMFDAGVSPWEKDKILLYATTRKPLRQTINLCFFADVDFNSNWRSFLNQTEDLIYEGFHANNMITDRKDLWNFYYTRQEADGYEMLINPGNENSYPDFMRNNSVTGIDAFGLLHQEEYTDRTYFRSSFTFLSNNTFTTEVYNHGTAVHEAGHAIFRLSDEYDGCACFQTEMGANVFDSMEGCEAFNAVYNLPNPECNLLKGFNNQPWYMPEKNVLFKTERECREFNVTNGFPRDSCQIFITNEGRFYRAFKGVCIMQDDGDRRVNSFQRVCQIAVENYYAELDDLLVDGGASGVPTDLPSTILLPNMFGYEAVIAVEVVHKENADYDLKVLEVQYGVPTKNFLRDREIDVKFMTASENTVSRISIDDPSKVLFHGKEGGSNIEQIGDGSCVIVIPFDTDLNMASLDYLSDTGGDFTVKGISKKIHQEFGVAEEIKKCYSRFLKQK